MQQLEVDNQPRDGTFTDTNTNSNKTNKTKQATNLWMDPPQASQQDRQYQAGQPWYSRVGAPSGFSASIATQ